MHCAYTQEIPPCTHLGNWGWDLPDGTGSLRAMQGLGILVQERLGLLTSDEHYSRQRVSATSRL